MTCSIWIYLTHSCNLRCNYCYQAHAKQKMSIYTAKASIDWAFATAQANPVEELRFVFYGGEPLINLDVFLSSVDYANQLSAIHKIPVRFTILTNATLMTWKIFEFIKNNNISMQISIDGTPDIHDKNRRTIDGRGSFDKIGGEVPLKEIAAYQKCVASLVVDPMNVDMLKDSIDFINNLGFKIMVFHLALEKNHEWSIDKLNIFEEQLNITLKNINLHKKEKDIISDIYISPLNNMAEKYLDTQDIPAEELLKKDDITICQAARTDWTIDVNGDIYPCSRVVDDVNLKRNGEEYFLGNVHLGIWEYDNLKKFRNWLPRKDPNDQCSRCQWKYICPNQCYALFVGIDDNQHKPWPSICKTTDVMARVLINHLRT